MYGGTERDIKKQVQGLVSDKVGSIREEEEKITFKQILM